MMLLRFLINEENVVFLFNFIKTKISMAFDFTLQVQFWLFKRNKLDVSAPNMEISRGNEEDAKSGFFPHCYDLHVLIFFIYQITKMCQDEDF
ncbi:hypothetical protein Pyn_07707 [Prunus yedoensis var. nudiflora]|uniref:Uncharacterized protein n=1 Tax=Prunus yedoensis var. nudiflora TaxID=2094558 RepID=A0A314YWI3_PRUYE|nr:hypothetical protein Pyn_07707 [Prunus yedoensis var. nudiflora]